MNKLRDCVLVLVVAAVLPGVVHGHAGEDHSEEKKPAASMPAAPIAVSPAPTFPGAAEASQRLSDGSLFVPKSVQRALGILTAAAQPGEFPRVLEMPGRVIAEPNAGGRIQAAQPGVIAAGPKGLAIVGQRVAKGQVLALLRPTLDAGSRADKQAALAELEAQASVMEQRLSRLSQLTGSVPKKDIEQARIELDGLQARRKAVASALGGGMALIAPVSGMVAASHVVLGQVVDTRDILFEIIDPRRLAVEALAFETLPAGLGTASARLGDLSGNTAGSAGKTIMLDFVGAGRSLREQSLPVMFRIRVPAGGEEPAIAVGQTLTVLAETREKQTGIAIPVSALVRNNANEWMVWVHQGAERFVPRRVRTVPLDARRVLVLAGLEGRERVVIQGAPSLVQVR